MHVRLRIELAVVEERQQVHRRKVTGRVVQEHVLRTGVRAADWAVFGACVPRVDRIVVLDAGISTGPSGVADGFPQIARFDCLGDFAVSPVDQVPIRIGLNSLEERISHTNRVVGVLARDRVIGFGVPICVIGREFDAVVALLCVIQHALDVCFWNCAFFRITDRGLEARVFGWIDGIFKCPVPRFNRRENFVELTLMHLGPGDDGCNFLLLQHLPVDVLFYIGVVGINDHHLSRATCGAAGFDGTGCTVTNFQKAHQAGGFTTTRQRFACTAKRRKVCTRAGAILEQTRFTNPQVHNPALVHQVI